MEVGSSSATGAGASEQARKVFVGRIPPGTSTEMLGNYFVKYGQVQEVKVVKDRDTGRERTFGFVLFFELASAARALADQQHAINGRQIDVKPAKLRGQSSSHANGMQQNTGRHTQNAVANGGHFLPNNRLFVGGLPRSLTLAEFRAHFEEFGTVDDAAIIIDAVTGLARGFGFVSFESGESLTRALQAADCQEGRFFQQLGGKEVEVKLALPRNNDEQIHLARAEIIKGCVNCHECMYHTPGNLQREMATAIHGARVLGLIP